MKRRIFTYMCASVLLLAGILTVLWSVLLQDRYHAQFRDGLSTQRVSIIGANGAVEFDNAADPSEMDNHLNRPEVAEALEKGFGASERMSDTLGETTYYYAMRLPDGRVLRLSFTADTVQALLEGASLLFALCLAAALTASLLLANRLTRRIVAPLAAFNLEDAALPPPYDELAPFLGRIRKQKREIESSALALVERANTIKAINDNMKEGLLLLSRDGVVLTANPAALELFGAGEELVGKSILYASRDIELLEKVKLCLKGEKAMYSLSRGGNIYDVFLNPVLDRGERSGAILLFLDVTAQSLAERQRKEFSANVSHELKTPLTTISALSEMIVSGIAKQEDIQAFAEKIGAQSQRLIAMIEDIMRLSQFDEGGPLEEREEFDLSALAQTVVNSLAGKAAEKGVRVNVTGERFSLSANRRMIDELMFNLLDNAIKYNKENGEVELSLIRNGDTCTISVRDTGIGIPKDQLGRVFERFYRVDKSRSQKTGGTGLGLSIVKHIAERHGGYAAVESRVGAGTKITCVIKGALA